jgi:hypothetical protein
MSIIHNRFCVLSAVLLVFLAGWVATAHAVILNWDVVAWTPGSLSNSYDVTGDGVNDITVAAVAQNNGVWTNDPTSGTLAPTINQTMTGGLSPVESSLLLAANLHTQSNVTINLSFTGTQPGATNVSFTIFDIDVTTNSDIIDSIYGVAPDGTHIAPTITNIGSAVDWTGTGLNQVLSGNVASPNNGAGSSNGNATISFGSTLIYDVFFTFSNTAGAPRFQDIALGDISFTPVPEINPAAAASASCIAAIGLTILLQRRARRAQKTVR